MLQLTPQMRILVAVEAVDFRKGIDSLAELCRAKLNGDPFSGCARDAICADAAKPEQGESSPRPSCFRKTRRGV